MAYIVLMGRKYMAHPKVTRVGWIYWGTYGFGGRYARFRHPITIATGRPGKFRDIENYKKTDSAPTMTLRDTNVRT